MAVFVLLARSLHCQRRKKGIHAYSAHNGFGPWHTLVKWLLVLLCLKVWLDLANSFNKFCAESAAHFSVRTFFSVLNVWME